MSLCQFERPLLSTLPLWMKYRLYKSHWSGTQAQNQPDNYLKSQAIRPTMRACKNRGSKHGLMVANDRLKVYTVKKGYRFSRPQPGCHTLNSPWPGIINLFRSGRIWLVTSRLGTEKSLTFFYSVGYLRLLLLVKARRQFIQ
jgi:hypothetical protein